MKPDWDNLQIEAARELAVRASNDPGLRDHRILTEARTGGAYLGLITVSDSSPLALVAVVTEVDGVMRPVALHTIVPTDQSSYFTQGSGWWPRPDALRWLWVVGRVDQPFGDASPSLRLGDASRALTITRDGWFAHISVAMLGQDTLTVDINEGNGWRHL